MRILVTANTTIGTKLLLFDLRNIEVAHVQTRMLLDIFPDFLIGSFRFRSGHVQFIHLQIWTPSLDKAHTTSICSVCGNISTGVKPSAL